MALNEEKGLWGQGGGRQLLNNSSLFYSLHRRGKMGKKAPCKQRFPHQPALFSETPLLFCSAGVFCCLPRFLVLPILEPALRRRRGEIPADSGMR